MTAAGPFEIYFDFDNTITEFDVLDDFISRFSINEEWKVAEEEWAAGAIGSRECLERQLAQVRISPEALADYLRTIAIDPGFPPILELLRSRGVHPVILSDSFSEIITAVLAHNGITGIPTFANRMRLEGDRPVISFPYFGSICTTCANCKTSHLVRRDRPAGTRKIYVGDGKSDICPAGFCEILFAKGSLFEHYATIRKDCHPFARLSEVLPRLNLLLS